MFGLKSHGQQEFLSLQNQPHPKSSSVFLERSTSRKRQSVTRTESLGNLSPMTTCRGTTIISFREGRFRLHTDGPTSVPRSFG